MSIIVVIFLTLIFRGLSNFFIRARLKRRSPYLLMEKKKGRLS